MISPERKHSSNSAMVSAISGSGYASRSGIPRPSRGSSARSSSFAYSSTRLDPQSSPTAPTMASLSTVTADEWKNTRHRRFTDIAVTPCTALDLGWFCNA